jgi:hypothetical protein
MNTPSAAPFRDGIRSQPTGPQPKMMYPAIANAAPAGVARYHPPAPERLELKGVH